MIFEIWCKFARISHNYVPYVCIYLKKLFEVCAYIWHAHICSFFNEFRQIFPKPTLTSTLYIFCLVSSYQLWLLIVLLLRSNWKILTVEMIRKFLFWKIGRGSEKNALKSQLVCLKSTKSIIWGNFCSQNVRNKKIFI